MSILDDADATLGYVGTNPRVARTGDSYRIHYIQPRPRARDREMEDVRVSLGLSRVELYRAIGRSLWLEGWR